MREILLIIGWVLERTFEWRGGWCNILESVPLKCFYFNKKKKLWFEQVYDGFHNVHSWWHLFPAVPLYFCQLQFFSFGVLGH